MRARKEGHDNIGMHHQGAVCFGSFAKVPEAFRSFQNFKLSEAERLKQSAHQTRARCALACQSSTMSARVPRRSSAPQRCRVAVARIAPWQAVRSVRQRHETRVRPSSPRATSCHVIECHVMHVEKCLSDAGRAFCARLARCLGPRTRWARHMRRSAAPDACS